MFKNHIRPINKIPPKDKFILKFILVKNITSLVKNITSAEGFKSDSVSNGCIFLNNVLHMDNVNYIL